MKQGTASIIFLLLTLLLGSVFSSLKIYAQTSTRTLTPTITSTRTPTPVLNIEFGKVETVYDWTTQKCDEDDRSDSRTKALIDVDGNVQLYAVSSVSNRKSIGDNLSDIVHNCRLIFANHDNPILRLYDDNNWLISPYTQDGVTIYGLVHMEFHGWEPENQLGTGQRACISTPHPPACWWNAINLAKSTDKGRTFNYATPPNQNVANTSFDFNPTYSFNIGFFLPSNIVAKDEYYYATTNVVMPSATTPPTPLYHGVCLMRTNTLDDPSSWRFWNGTSFSTPARGVPASGTCASINAMKGNLHWNDYLNAYTTIGTYNNPSTRWFIKNGPSITTWNKSTEITSIPPEINETTKYHTLIQPGAETRNFEDIGRSPWMYYVVINNGSDIDVKRIRVRFNKPEDVGKYDVLNLRFNEYKGTKALDSSFYVNDGTFSRGAGFVQEGDTKFIRFNSGNVTVPYNPNLDLSSDITVDMRLRTTQHPGGYIPIVSKESPGKRNYGIWLTRDGKIHFSTNNGSGNVGSESDSAVNDGAWHKVTVTFKSATGLASYWIDGVLDKEVTQGGKLSDGLNFAPVNIGSNSFIGDLDNVTLYNYPTINPVITPTLTPTITPTPTPVPALTFTLSFEGVYANVGGKNIKISFYQGNQLVESKDGIAAYQGGAYKGTISNPPVGTFDIKIKTDRHLSRKLSNITITAGINTISFLPLLAGDIEVGLGQRSDNTINLLDFNRLLSELASPPITPVSDLNYDGVVDAIDYSTLSENFTKGGE